LFFASVKSIPSVAAAIEEQKKKIKTSLQSELQAMPEGDRLYTAIPDQGVSHDDIMKSMNNFLEFEQKKGTWTNHKVSG
jgi:hypothetical protein